jgi:hypothetical protein
MSDSFSKRHGYASSSPEITIREGVTDYVRHYALKEARGEALSAHVLREIVCRIVRAAPDTAGNWSDSNILREIEDLVSNCKWWMVYDIIEAIYAHLSKYQNWREEGDYATPYAAEVNRMFMDEGIGWKLGEGRIVSRGSDSFEIEVKNAVQSLAEAKRVTASSRLAEAFADLSRRPKPDLAGAITHAMGALECVARDVTSDEKATLGEIIKANASLFPPPLDKAVAFLWGYASNTARHVVEGTEPAFEEAELIIGTSANVAAYLSKKLPRK